MTSTTTTAHATDQTGRPGRLCARPVLAPRPHTPPGATTQRRSLDEHNVSCAPTSIAAVLTVAVSDDDTVHYDVYPEDTNIRMGDAGTLRLWIDDRALVKLAVLLNEAARTLSTAREHTRR